MKLFNDTPFRVYSRRAAFDPESMFLSVVVKGTFTLAPDRPCEPLAADKQPKITAAARYSDRHGNSRRTDNDMVPFKPRADCLFIGSACAPGGEPVEGLEVEFGVGRINKRLSVWGDRQWVRETDGGVRLEGPAPFTEKPIRNEYAHGGPTSKFNQYGIGFGELAHEPGATLRAANILPVGEGVVPWDRDEVPEGLGVLAPNTLPRRKLAGTYDSAWLFRRRPLPPADFDPGFFNGARPDQQVDGYLRGDEEILLRNLHPRHETVRSRLPGIRVRCFVQRKWPRDGVETEEFAEVLTNLDTCIVDADEDRVTLLWRGTMEIVSRGVERLHYMMVSSEPLDQHQHRDFYLKRLESLIAAHRPPKPQTGQTEAQKKRIAEMHRQGVEDTVATLRQARADEALIAEVARQETVDDALKVMQAYVEDIARTLPKAEE